MLMLSVLCRDMVVFCCDRNFLIYHFNFVGTISAMLRHFLYCYSQFMSRQTFLCRDRLFLCHNSVVLPCITKTELCVAIDSFHVATKSSLLLVAG